MIHHLFHDGSVGIVYQVGDPVFIKPVPEGSRWLTWIGTGHRGVVVSVKDDALGSCEVRWSKEWGTKTCYRSDIEPCEDTVLKGTIKVIFHRREPKRGERPDMAFDIEYGPLIPVGPIMPKKRLLEIG